MVCSSFRSSASFGSQLSKEEEMAKKFDVKYVAGLVDGCAAIGTARFMNKNTGKHSWRLQIRMDKVSTPKSAATFKTLKSMYGGSLTTYNHSIHKSTQYIAWQLGSRESILHILEEIKDHLTIKKSRAEAIINFLKSGVGDAVYDKKVKHFVQRQAPYIRLRKELNALRKAA